MSGSDLYRQVIAKTQETNVETFNIAKLPDIDQRQIKRGRCPWCLCRLVENGKNDFCPECGDEFTGKITIED